MISNPEGPESSIITSIATTITIGSASTNSLANVGESCSMAHSTQHATLGMSGQGGVGDNNTFRPILTHPSPSSQRSVKVPKFSERVLPPQMVGYHASLPRPPRPSSRYTCLVTYISVKHFFYQIMYNSGSLCIFFDLT